MQTRILLAALPVLASSVAMGDVLFTENFDSLVLGPNVDEPTVSANAFTHTPPAGWSLDNSGLPSGGRTEWRGWSFANRDFWVTAAGNQNRGQFTLASGNVAVADPDEWDDSPNASGTVGNWYNTLMRTPAISLNNVVANTVSLQFASSWRPEGFDDGDNTNNQTAVVRVSFNGGVSFTEVLRYDSDPNGLFFQPDSTNELVNLSLNNPAGASSLIVQFGLLEAGNDWWWAIDNVQVSGTVIPGPSAAAFLGLAALAAGRRRR